MKTSAQPKSTTERPESFLIKGGLFPMTLLELKTADLVAIKTELEEKVVKSPAFFKQSAIVFGFEQLSENDLNQIDVAQLQSLCRELHLVPTAIRGGNDSINQQTFDLGLATLPRGRNKTDRIDKEPIITDQAPADISDGSSGASASKTITTPVRSGQQIYAPGGDLIILSSVSPGAEVLADGNIHIYGALRGRALAGVQGNECARIFCTSQEAELVSVAGQFIVDENLRSTHWRQAVQIYLADGRISISPLS